ncbi:MAG TPA: hypothetical protein VGL20_06595 [Candidatus Dormibacteraeota bacterium]
MRAPRAAAAGAIAAAAAATGLLTTGAEPPPAPASGCAVAVTAVSPAVAHRGEQVTVSGSGFTCDGAAAAPPSVTVDGRPQSVLGDAGDGALVIEAGDAWGAVQVSVRDRCGRCSPARSNDDHLLLGAPATTGGTRLVTEGGRFSVAGSGLDLGGHLAGAGATACGEALDAGARSDTALALTAPAHFCQGPLTLRLVAFTDTEHSATTAVDVPGGALDTAMTVSGISPAHAAAGERVSVAGSGFGGSGTALLHGRPVPSSWFDRAVEVVPVAGSAPGELELVRADGRRVDAGALGVDAAPSNRPAPVTSTPTHLPPTPPATPSPGAAAAAVPAPPPALALRPARSSGEPGRDLPFTVTLTAAGAPVAGAAVEVVFARAPGGDASVTPAHGVTDAGGRVSGVVRLSRHPGEHVLVARAGPSSDRITVAACCAPAIAAGALRAGDAPSSGGAQRILIAAALAACLVLFVSGFVMNLVTGASRTGRIRLQ